MKSFALFVAALTLIACDTMKSTPMSDSARAYELVTTGAREAFYDGRGVAMTPASEPQSGIAGGTARVEAPLQVVVPSTMVIRNGNVTVQVDSLEIAIDHVRQLAISLGGYVGNISILTGAHQVRSATLEMKIPAARFDSAMTGMPVLGKVEQSTSTAQDVGEEWVDVNVRVANSKRLETRLVSLLSTRTGKLADVIAVERELARVRQEIERYEGRMRYLSTRVATSTIVANVHEKAPIIAARPGTNVFVTAFLNMGRNFVSFLATAIEMLGVLVPLALIAWLGALAWRRWRRSRVVAPA